MANEKAISDKFKNEILGGAVVKDGEATGGTKKQNVPQNKETETPCPVSNWPYR